MAQMLCFNVTSISLNGVHENIMCEAFEISTILFYCQKLFKTHCMENILMPKDAAHNFLSISVFNICDNFKSSHKNGWLIRRFFERQKAARSATYVRHSWLCLP